MPTYAYTCTACGHAFDIHQSFEDAPLTVCPQCQGRLRKVFSPVGVVFKGSGFYRTDARSSRSSGAPAATGSSGTTSGGDGASSSSSSSSDKGGSASSSSAPAATSGSSGGSAAAKAAAS